ncbi:polar amino acid transport system permease protein [Thermomonospora echinospora]|uniref:Polar amino acid transport system permease protein n=1 Tax=Thermomonospora echinospora TaxID=1992 RepID=A0A1H5V8F8_9ACTN|nr:amino acid ABC transporter permease [Thermomonospora echinospora]SEF82737.1 polar amino acid transport system permease protein [Thermomonospora echinospora]
MTTSATTEPSGPARKTPGRTGLSPRQRRRISLGVQSTVLAAGLLLVVLLVDWPLVRETFLDFGATREMYPDLFTIALKNTVIYTLSAYAVGFSLGLVVALMRLSSLAVYRWLALVFVEIFRGLPALLTLMIVGYGLPIALGGPVPGGTVGAVAVGLGLVAAAYMAETFRAGIQAVPKGQLEAARSLGMSHTRAMFSIVIPQALRIVIPPLTNELVLLFKDSSLVSALGIAAAGVELTKMGSDFAINTADSTPFVVAGACYLIITVPLGILVRRLEARQAKAR